MTTRTAFGQHTLPREYFTSEEIFRAERKRIFARSWLLSGHVSQLEKPGSYFLFELDQESVIVVRGEAKSGTGTVGPAGHAAAAGHAATEHAAPAGHDVRR